MARRRHPAPRYLPLTKRRLLGVWNTFAYYVFLKRDSPAFVGHNPLAGTVYAYAAYRIPPAGVTFCIRPFDRHIAEVVFVYDTQGADNVH